MLWQNSFLPDLSKQKSKAEKIHNSTFIFDLEEKCLPMVNDVFMKYSKGDVCLKAFRIEQI